MAANDARKYDIIVFGATGFTGEFVVEELTQVAGEKTWAVAGRNAVKIRETMNNVKERTGKDMSSIEVIVADAGNVDSIVAMVKQCRVLINCVGPYRYYGEPVVKACIENGTSHVDLAGETLFTETMQLKYNAAAEAAGVYIVGACGYDSIPADIGLNFVRQHMPGDVSSVETVVEFNYGPLGTAINYGTYHTMIDMFSTRGQMKGIHRQLYPTELPEPPYPLHSRGNLFKYHEPIHGWCAVNASSDRECIERSLRYNYEHRGWRPMDVKMYIKGSSLGQLFGLGAWAAMVAIMTSCKCGKRALLNNPNFFGFGMFPREGPTRAQLAETTFTYWFFANGWADRLADPHQQRTNKPDYVLACRVDGRDPGYAVTATSIVACALTILDERDKMPGSGGVMPPGAAFAETSIISHLHSRGLKFTVIDGPRKMSN